MKYIADLCSFSEVPGYICSFRGTFLEFIYVRYFQERIIPFYVEILK